MFDVGCFGPPANGPRIQTALPPGCAAPAGTVVQSDCPFCGDRGLQPAESLTRAFEGRDPHNPHPLWHNFRGQFRAIGAGNARLDIPACNGGLFAPKPGAGKSPGSLRERTH
jgi:hypothetical protein